ncbi:MAG: hypothetical protein ACTSQK_11480, partial [Candidatus Heimdallarchaeota archaeon]
MSGFIKEKKNSLQAQVEDSPKDNKNIVSKIHSNQKSDFFSERVRNWMKDNWLVLVIWTLALV